jgi:uncharacterized membrane protein
MTEIHIMRAFIKKTIDLMISGVLFFIPLYTIVYILVAFEKQMEKFAKLVADYFPVDTVVGFTMASIVGWAFVIGVLVILGLISKTSIALRVSKAIEENILEFIPGYRENSEKIRAKLDDKVEKIRAKNS